MRLIPSSFVTVLGTALEILQLPGPPDRPTLVFLHEGLGSVALWRQWPQQLCSRLGCAGLVYSRQGYGRSQARQDVRGAGRLQPDYMHHEALQVLPALLQALDIAKPVLIGHSDGGTIALLHASHCPVQACIVMAPHVMVEDLSIQAIDAARQAFMCDGLRQRLAPFHDDVDGAFWQWNDVWLSRAFRSYDIRAEITAIEAPLLAIQGEDDPYGSMAQIDDIADAVPHARRLKLARCGHSPHRDQPEAVNQGIEAFLQGTTAGVTNAP